MRQLTVGLIAGPFRQRAERAIDSLLSQNPPGGLTIHVIDFDPGGSPLAISPLPREVDLTVSKAPNDWLIGQARAAIVRQATTPLVGFLEEHFLPVDAIGRVPHVRIVT